MLAHGGGGRLTRDLIADVFLPRFDNSALRRLGDSAVLPASELEAGARLAFTTDAYVVRPLFFPGGDVGRLAICGTVNDLAMAGAQPLYLSAGFIIEEGFPIARLSQIAESMRDAATEAAVAVVAGDTKVVERGSADGLFITTAGVGVVPANVDLGVQNARPGDALILSGTIGDHGIAIAIRRAGLEMASDVRSDVAPLNNLVARMLAASDQVRALRDPTRGGLAMALNEIATESGVGIMLDEASLPISDPVLAACELFGYDPLHIANEGKLLAVVSASDAERLIDAMRDTRYGEEAAIIGEVIEAPVGRVLLRTRIGSTRIVAMPSGELLPRIC